MRAMQSHQRNEVLNKMDDETMKKLILAGAVASALAACAPVTATNPTTGATVITPAGLQDLQALYAGLHSAAALYASQNPTASDLPAIQKADAAAGAAIAAVMSEAATGASVSTDAAVAAVAALVNLEVPGPATARFNTSRFSPQHALILR